MTAALSLDASLSAPSGPVAVAPVAPVVPAELLALFEESPKARASFYRLAERERRGFVQYVVEAKTPITRERRAAIVAMSLIGLASDLPDNDLRGKLG